MAGLGLFAFVAIGCNNVLGLSGYTFVDDGSGPGAGGTTAGTGGDAGAGGEPGECMIGNADMDYVKACALALSCTTQGVEMSLSMCVEQGRLSQFGSLDCLRNKSDCAGYFACTGERFEREVPGGCQGLWSCDGDLARGCLGQEAAVYYDCKKFGGTCVATATGDTDYPCQPDKTIDCEDNAEPVCAEGYSVQCIGGQVFGRSCDVLGGCDESKGLCTTVTEECEGTGSACDGTRLSRCGQGHLAKTDCADAGLLCVVPAGGGGATCRAPGCSAQQVKACKESCQDETQAVLCLGGAQLVFDCGVNGARCVETTITEKTYASCE